MANEADLTKVEYMRDYIAHLKYARERLLETYNGVRQHSQFVANEVWQDTVSHRFMEMLEQKHEACETLIPEIESAWHMKRVFHEIEDNKVLRKEEN